MALSNTAVPLYYGEFRESVLNGEIPVNQEISMEMNRIDFLIDSPEYYYDDGAIDGFIEFCESEMTLTDGSDLILLPSFKLWAESLLSWYYFIEEKRWDHNLRREVWITRKKRLVNKQFLIVGRGAAKSLYDTLIQAYFAVVDTTTTQQVVTAPTMKMADETMSPIRTAITRSRGPLFKFLTKGSILSNTFSKVKLASTKVGIQNFMTGSTIEVRAMTIDKLQGLRSKVNTVDEWLSGKVKEDVIGTLEQGASKIDDWIILATSSEGTARNGPGDTIKMELYDILRGKYFNPHVSIWYYKLDDVSEVSDPEMWAKANPNLGMTVTYDTYQKDVERAESQPATRSDILAKRFGIPLEGHTYFFPHEHTLPHRKQSFNKMECVMGGDLSQGDDFCAFTFLFPMTNGYFGVKTRSYVTSLKVQGLSRAMKLKYDEFIKEGTLIVMDTPILDMMEVYEDLDEFILANEYSVIAFGYDPYNAKEFVERWTTENGAWGVEVVKQGVRTESVPLGELRILAKERMLLFDEVLMKFAMGNCIAIEDNNGNRKLSKRRADEKIDNVAALMDAWVAFKRNQGAFM